MVEEEKKFKYMFVLMQQETIKINM